MPPTVRTFIAVEITPEIRQQAVRLIGQMRRTAADVRWVDPDRLHFTVKFLGDVDNPRIAEVCQAAQRVAAGQEAFRVEVAGAGAFPTGKRPRTLWLGVGDGLEPMRQLNSELEDEFQLLGFAREGRRYNPHLTIGRVRRGGQGLDDLAELIDEHRDYTAGSLTVNELVVFSSRLDRDGPAYTPLGRARFGEV